MARNGCVQRERGAVYRVLQSCGAFADEWGRSLEAALLGTVEIRVGKTLYYLDALSMSRNVLMMRSYHI